MLTSVSNFTVCCGTLVSQNGGRCVFLALINLAIPLGLE